MDRIGSETVRLWWCREYEPLSMAMGGGPEGGIRQVLNSFGRPTPAAGSCRNATTPPGTEAPPPPPKSMTFYSIVRTGLFIHFFRSTKGLSVAAKTMSVLYRYSYNKSNIHTYIHIHTHISSNRVRNSWQQRRVECFSYCFAVGRQEGPPCEPTTSPSLARHGMT